MSATADPPPPVKRRRWRRLLLLLIPLSLVIATWTYLYFSADIRLAQALADTERRDPHWRLEDIQAERAEVPGAENSAAIVVAVKAKMPPGWAAWDMVPAGEYEDEPNLQKALENLKPNERLTARERAAMRPEMLRAALALQEARRFADFPRGRHPVTYSRDFISTMLSTLQDSRTAAYLLQNDALFHAQSGDLDGAVLDCRALINNARSIGDEPDLIAQLIRMAIRAIAVGQAERTLGQGELPPDDLARLQAMLAEEAEEEPFRIAVRGERAGLDRLMQSLQDGSTSISLMRNLMVARPAKRTWLLEEQLLYVPGVVRANRAALLERMNEVVDISHLPPEEQPARFAELQEAIAKDPVLVRELMPAMDKVATADRRTKALLRCAAAGPAVERYRLQHGRWPESLADLKPDLLAEVPLDPFDGQPLRYRNDGVGVIVYSIGPDGKDDGGERETINTHKPGTDLGFRLWNKELRGQVRK